ncbi:MAG: O-antigen ligase family protein [Nitrospirae bacterium]|jgi:O-antigen ligase|nr:O-antigen ligase family protein [Nitrospirota bacterium]
MDRRTQSDTRIVLIISIILIFSVLSFGSVEIWSSASVSVSVLTLFIFWIIFRTMQEHSFQNTDSAHGRHEKFIFIALFGLLAFIFIQTIPLPSSVIRYLSPGSYELYSFYSVERDPAMYISLHAYKTRIEFIRILTYVIFFILVSYSIKDIATLERLLKVLIYFGFVLAVFAIIQKAAWTGKIYWLRELPHGGTPFGPFVNRNHYAGLIGMLIPLSLGLAFTRKSLERKILFGFFSLIMAVSLFLSLSRAGIISFFGGMTIFALFLSWNRFRAKKVWALVSFVFIVFLYLIYLGIDPVIDRFYETDLTGEDRFTVWAETLRALKDFYITGSGLGTFINIFPLYSSAASASIYDHAHNDYLEFMLETGIIGTALFMLFLIAYFIYILRGSWQGRTGIIRISIISSITTIAIHSIFDFNLHITSNALMLSAVSGMAFALMKMRAGISREGDRE